MKNTFFSKVDNNATRAASESQRVTFWFLDVTNAATLAGPLSLTGRAGHHTPVAISQWAPSMRSILHVEGASGEANGADAAEEATATEPGGSHCGLRLRLLDAEGCGRGRRP
jgi:hypothetical protein